MSKKKRIKKTASRKSVMANRVKSIAQKGKDVRVKVRDLTLETIRERHLTLDDLSALAKEFIHGAASGLKSSLPSSRQSALSQVMKGVSDAWAVTAEASEHALQHARRYGLTLTRRDLNSLSQKLKRLEGSFVDTVSDSAVRLEADVRREVISIVNRVEKAGTEIRPAAERAQRAISGHIGALAGEVASTSANVGKKALSSALLATSGLLDGMGKAISKKRGSSGKGR